MEQDLLSETEECCREEGIYCAVDECFLEFLSDVEERSLIHQLEKNPKLIVLRAITKLYAVPGLRLGYAFTGDAELVRRMRENTSEWNVSIPAQKAGIAALKETEYVEHVRRLIRTERPTLEQGLRDMGFHIYPGEANFIFFSSQVDLYPPLLLDGILIRDCGREECSGKHLFRIAVRTEEENRFLLASIRNVCSSEPSA